LGWLEKLDARITKANQISSDCVYSDPDSSTIAKCEVDVRSWTVDN